MSKNNIDIYDAIPSVRHLIEENVKLKKENQELKIEIKELKILNENLNKYIDNFRKNSDIQYLHDNQQIYKLKQAIKVLKEKKVNLYELQFSFSLNEYNIVARGSGFDELTQKQYELLKQVFESVGEE